MFFFLPLLALALPLQIGHEVMFLMTRQTYLLIESLFFIFLTLMISNASRSTQ
jgi:hypothetical protein